MKMSQVFPTRFLTASDLGGKSYTLTIREVKMEEMQSHDSKTVIKPVCWFSNAQKGFVLNVTNARTIVALYGDESDDWKGKRITIFATRVKAFGKLEDAIRVKEEVPAEPMPTAKAAHIEEASDLDDLDDLMDYEDS